MTAPHIRAERRGDEAAIHQVTAEAFADHPHSAGAEPKIVEALRAEGELALSLVAVNAGAIVGHAAWSLARLSNGDGGWFALGPISVAPRRQRQGIGRALVEQGCAMLREEGARGVVLLGDPDYYSRLGFVRGTPLHIEGPLADYFQVRPFTAVIPAASVTFAPAFGRTRLRAD